MYLMYVDESGDPGLIGSMSPFYVLTGVVLHELRWKQSLDRLISFRRGMKASYGLHVTTEIHASEFISNARPAISRIPRQKRLLMLRDFLDEAAKNTDMSIITVIVDKTGKSANYNVFEFAWQALIQRFENTIRFSNFPGPRNADDKGMIFPDVTQRKLTRLLRKMRYHNYVPVSTVHGGGSRNLPIEIVIEDPNPRDSGDSYFIQLADVAAYFAHQHVKPNKYVKKKGARNFYKRLDPILCKRASPNDPDGLGLVRL
jgi:hypothetical protein